MFAHHNPTPEYPRGLLKRYHEEEAIAELANSAAIGFNEHRNKRVHTLPLRTSPSARKWGLSNDSPADGLCGSPGPADMTPPSSFGEEPSSLALLHRQREEQLQQESSIPMLGSVDRNVDMDMDMAMDDEQSASQHLPMAPISDLDQHLVPGPLQPDETSETTLAARIPTPLQPSFAAQVRGGNWGGAPGNAMQVGASSGLRHPVLEGSSSLHPEADLHDPSVPRSLDNASMADWGMVQNRSLPSPISESGGEYAGNGDNAGHLGHPDTNMDGTLASPSSMLGPSPDHDHICPHDQDQSLMATPSRSLAAESIGSSSPEHLDGSPSAMDTDPAVTPSPRKGHTRSRHTIMAWTQQPGMKKSFSIGYRSDCEKCRNRVPGHFNHIIVS